MAVWPTMLPPPSQGVEEELYRPQIRAEFEANYIQTRPRASRGRRRFPLSWKIMSEDDYRMLETFFLTNQGASFEYTHPITANKHTCVFAGDSISARWMSGGRRADVRCPIEEV
ncbi:MAG TPA: hypothetical protein VLH60_05080 [Sedimentisphaerales bacterium]|nr:hypothetical protein [Sedimentisphaerales bacterium]